MTWRFDARGESAKLVFACSVDKAHWIELTEADKAHGDLVINVHNFGFGGDKHTSVKRAFMSLTFPFVLINKFAFDEAINYLSSHVHNCHTVKVDFIRRTEQYQDVKLGVIICMNATNLDKLANYTYTNKEEQYTINSTHLYQTVLPHHS
eukprot:TRINITY_DN9570_c0_g1_i4.p1 TRINITY_DN9570_c0_g1~~TRINITY_DN9570_c0_g1_i4.p1  ORF type:complete len:150 (-),score=27.41 TRINITY_DN9570_c0_g1_i4:446-895(-)